MILGSCPDLANSTSKYWDLLPSSKCLPGHSLQRIQRHLLRNHLPHPNNELNLNIQSLLTINVSLQPINTIKELCDESSLSQPGFANKVPNKISTYRDRFGAFGSFVLLRFGAFGPGGGW